MRASTLLVTAATVSLSFLLAGCGPSKDASTGPRVAVFLFLGHPTVDRVAEIAQATLKENYPSVRFEPFNAQGDFPTATMIAKQLAAGNYAAILVIGTPAVQACAAEVRQTPVVFGAMTDPVATGVAQSFERPGGNLTGTSDRPLVGPNLDLIRELQPKARTIGVMLNPSEANSQVCVDMVRPACQTRGLVLKEMAVSSSSEVPLAAQAMAETVDAVLVIEESTVIVALDAVITHCRARRVPVYTMVQTYIKHGCVAGIGVDYDVVARQTGVMLGRVLAGAKPAETPVQIMESPRLSVNVAAARAVGLALPPALLARAEEVVGDTPVPRQP